ncbi:hypothetical protein BSZ39_02030 [Bowdeniella nasicola]|uniref:Uncharacterized protein n=2 Tax=Bowdeniella nasicola TaxID=208480 RepID=A0A1Q5Q4R9_9ACTO|nr:hypothetical protein BSZ39_02030 [Bowdeniella nasicola]
MDRLAQARSILQEAETRTGLRMADDAWPVPPTLRPLLPGGLPRGSAVHVAGSRMILWSLAAAIMGENRWCVVIGMRDVGWYAAGQAGVGLDRVLYLPTGATSAVLAAAIDGADVVVLGSGGALGAGDRRALAGRLRNRGTTLLTTVAWPGAISIAAEVVQASGCEDGAGYVTQRIIQVRTQGRRVMVAAGEKLEPYRHLAVVS